MGGATVPVNKEAQRELVCPDGVGIRALKNEAEGALPPFLEDEVQAQEGTCDGR
jgi:hypothetical protein